MKFALVNPNWDFAGSTYFGCRDPHLPLELMFAARHMVASGHEPLLIDAHIDNLTLEQTKRKVKRFQPDFLVMSTAPTYLFWRCPPPELRVPITWMREINADAVQVIIGPHASATPAPVMRKTGCGVALRGEPDETLAQLASSPWSEIPGCCFRTEDGLHISASLSVADMRALTALSFENYNIGGHWHRHHVFTNDLGLGAELEFARGCPWSCIFCNKSLFRNQFRERGAEAVLEEINTLIRRGVEYVYFIDEVFGIGKNAKRLLEGIAERRIKIGIQTRIDLWNEETLDLLSRAHCISMECGIESITETGREDLNKNCHIDTGHINELLVLARRRIPWVQANLVLTEKDDRRQIQAWQEHLRSRGVWASEPVPMFPFPGSPLYTKTFGAPPDDAAWERAHHHYLAAFAAKGYSDIQEQKPVPLEELEACTS